MRNRVIFSEIIHWDNVTLISQLNKSLQIFCNICYIVDIGMHRCADESDNHGPQTQTSANLYEN